MDTSVPSTRQQRLENLGRCDLDQVLREHLVDDNAALSTSQRAAFDAISQGSSLILFTSGDRRLEYPIFLLPACLDHSSRTIVVTSNRARAHTIWESCADNDVSCREWRAGLPLSDPITTATPDDFLEGEFVSTIRHLAEQQGLDRIVLLDSDTVAEDAAAPSPLLSAARVIPSLAPQTVFIATDLPPHARAPFFRCLEIDPTAVSMACYSYIPSNISFSRELVDSISKEAPVLILDHLESIEAAIPRDARRYPPTRFVVFVSRSFRIQLIAPAIGALAFQSDSPADEQSQDNFRTWEESGGGIVTTRQFRHLFTQPDIRLVVHVAAFATPSVFMAECRCAGLDGLPAYSLAIDRTDRDPPQQNPVEAHCRLKLFLYTHQSLECRRDFLSRVLDGAEERTYCRPEHHACQFCRRRRAAPARGSSPFDAVDRGFEEELAMMAARVSRQYF